jgi:hypothetical protein
MLLRMNVSKMLSRTLEDDRGGQDPDNKRAAKRKKTDVGAITTARRAKVWNPLPVESLESKD